MQINLNYQKGFKVQLFQILLFQLIFTSDVIITNLIIYTEGNIYLNAWTKFPLNRVNRQTCHPIPYSENRLNRETHFLCCCYRQYRNVQKWYFEQHNNTVELPCATASHKRPPVDVNWTGDYHKCIYWKFVQKSSGSAFSIIVFIGRVLSGGMFMTIQEFYPKNG